MQTTYKHYLRAVGRKPIPAHDRLRTPRQEGCVEITSRGAVEWIGGKAVARG